MYALLLGLLLSLCLVAPSSLAQAPDDSGSRRPANSPTRSLSAPGVATHAQGAAAATARADTLRRAGDLKGALAGYSEAIRLNPTYAPAYVGRAVATDILATGDPKPALADVERAISLDPRLAQAYSVRANLRAEWLNDNAGALSDLGEAIRLAPDDPAPRIQRGIMFDTAAKLDGAISDFDAAIRLDPRHVGALGFRAAVHERKGDLDRAKADYDRAIRLSTVFSRAPVGGEPAYASPEELASAVARYAEIDTSLTEFARLDSLQKGRAELLAKKGDVRAASTGQQPVQRVAGGEDSKSPLDDRRYAALFLQDGDLPGLRLIQDSRHPRGGTDAEFAKQGGERAGFAVWMGADDRPLWRVVDVRWVFPTAEAAATYHQATLRKNAENLAPVRDVPTVGEEGRVFGGVNNLSAALGIQLVDYAYIFRVGRVVVKLYAAQGSKLTGVQLRPEHMKPVAEKIAGRIAAALQ